MAEEELRDAAYRWSLNLVKNGFKLEGIFLLLSTWNFAYLRYHMKTFDLEKFMRVLNNCDFTFFKDKKFETLDLTDKQNQEKIMKIYSALSDFRGIRYVGAVKVMHLLSPEVFVMWDSRIIRSYKAKTTPQGYLDFMTELQRKYNAGKFKTLKLREGVTIPRAIDLYNLENA